MFEEVKSRPNFGALFLPPTLSLLLFAQAVRYFLKWSAAGALSVSNYLILFFWTACSVMFGWGSLRYRKLHIHDGVLDVYNGIGSLRQSIYLDDILNWEEGEVRSNNGGTDYVLTLNLKEGSFSVPGSGYYSNYTQLKDAITTGRKNANESYTRKQKKEGKDEMPIALGALVVALFLLFAGFYTFLHTNNIESYYPVRITEQITNISGGNGQQLQMHLTEYPAANFVIPLQGNGYRDKQFALQLSRGDSVTVTVNEDDYNKKLELRTPMGLLEKYLSGHDEVLVYEMKDREKNSYHYELSDYRKDTSMAKSMLIVGTIFLLIGFVKIVQLRNRRYDEERESWMETKRQV